jgi:prepilin-type N-terminal cleavage/methylation domain-containing protein
VKNRIRTLVADEQGYSLVELLTVVLIMGIVIGALTMLFVRASNSELDMNRRFQAQENARLAMDTLRREIHCASGVSPSGSSSSIVLTIPSQCPTAHGFTSVRWCVVAPPAAQAGRYALYRSTAATCTTSNGVKRADYLTTQSIFGYTVQSSQSLSNLAVALIVNAKPGSTHGTFHLSDSIVLRNSSRTCITGSPSPPC